ncbi:hypothetical protein AB0O28_39385 [Microbispora sp. NPDC088329]
MIRFLFRAVPVVLAILAGLLLAEYNTTHPAPPVKAPSVVRTAHLTDSR